MTAHDRTRRQVEVPRYEDVLFDMPDGRQMLVEIGKDGTYRLCERATNNHADLWGPPVFGEVVN